MYCLNEAFSCKITCLESLESVHKLITVNFCKSSIN